MFIATLAVTTHGCRTDGKVSRLQETSANTLPVADTSEDVWSKRAWMDKAARTLLYGTAGMDDAMVNTLGGLPRDQIVDKLMEDPRFSTTVLDFNQFFLGIKQNSAIVDGNFFLAGSRGAAFSAFDFSHGGNYFSLFDWNFEPRSILSPWAKVRPDNDGNDRKFHFEKAKSILQNALDELNQESDPKKFCQIYQRGYVGSEFFYAGLVDANVFFSLLYSKLSPSCSQALLSSKDALISDVQRALADLIEFEAAIDKAAAKTADVANLVLVSSPRTSYGGYFENFDERMWSKLQNSSTNYNRKRSAYILKTFFCDDLTPLKIVAPAAHANDRHASDPSCAACHYKLDPMAGFFRTRGLGGRSYPLEDNQIQFDDSRVLQGAEYAKYLDTWKAPPDSGRIWDVGFIRSADQPQLNSYGETLEDLFKIIKTAPETKTCLTRRLAEYTLGIKQTYDGGWIKYLAQNFIDGSMPDAPNGASSAAFKKNMKAMVLSNAFIKEDPSAAECYDFAPGAPASQLPCQISFIIQKECATCHSNGGGGGLDLTQWAKRPDGHLWFSHKDPVTQGNLPFIESQTRLLNALSSSDVDERMPLNKAMDAIERATLFKWLQSQPASVATGEEP